MKRFLLFLAALVIAGVSYAQDVIVQKDGTTIQAKVLKVNQSEVEYKMFNNQNGPTYKISTTGLQSINYENGSKDSFVTPNYNPNIVTNETATQFSNDEKLLDIYKNRNKKILTPEMLYKKGKHKKVAGYIVGSTLFAVGIASIIVGSKVEEYEESLLVYGSINEIRHSKIYNSDRDVYFYGGYVAMAGAVAIGVPLIVKGSSLQKKSREQIHSVSAVSQNINFDNGASLNIGVDVMSNDLSYEKTPGIGLRFNF